MVMNGSNFGCWSHSKSTTGTQIRTYTAFISFSNGKVYFHSGGIFSWKCSWLIESANIFIFVNDTQIAPEAKWKFSNSAFSAVWTKSNYKQWRSFVKRADRFYYLNIYCSIYSNNNNNKKEAFIVYFLPSDVNTHYGVSCKQLEEQKNKIITTAVPCIILNRWL